MFFQRRIMASEDVKAYNRSVIFQNANVNAEATNGAFVALRSPAVTIFSTNDKTTFIAATPSANTEAIYILDIAESPYVTSGTNVFRVLDSIIDLKAPAGIAVRARKPKLDDLFELGSDNFASSPTVGQFAIPTASSKLATPVASIDTAKFCIKILESITKSIGVSSSLTVYLCQVVTAV